MADTIATIHDRPTTRKLAPLPAKATTDEPGEQAADVRWSLVAVTALAPLAWGATYFVTTEALPPDRPLLAGLLRALPAGILLAAATRRRPMGAWWIKAAVLGVLNIGGFFALLFLAAYRLPGGVAATMGAIQPLLAAGLAALLLDERLRRRNVAAGVVGVIGVALLVLRADARLDTLGIAAGLLGAAAMATGVVLTKHWGRPVPLLAFTSWQLVAGGLFLVPLTWGIEGLPATLTATNIAGFVWFGTIGTAVAYSLWFRGIQQLPVARVALLALLTPVVASIVGWAALDQTLSIGQIIGVVLVLGAVIYGQNQGISTRGKSATRRQTVHVDALSAAPVDVVWPLLADVTTWPAWSSFDAATYARNGDPSPHGVGAQRSFRVGPLRSVDTVLQFEPPVRLSYDYAGPLPIKDYRADVELVATATGTLIVWHSEFVASFPLLSRLMRLVLRKVLGDLATGLARAAEKTLRAPGSSEISPTPLTPIP